MGLYPITGMFVSSGIYHYQSDVRKFYPAECLQVLEKVDYAEKPLLLKAPAADPNSARMVIALKTRTHSSKTVFNVDIRRQLREDQHRVWARVDF